MGKTIALLFSVVLTACVLNAPRPAETQAKYDLVISPTSRDEQFVDDVGISIKPIMLERANATDALFASYEYWNPRNTNERGKAKNILVNIPVFEVQVINTTSHTISFQKTAVRLIDDAGNNYQAQLKQDVVDFVEQQLNNLERRGWATDRAVAIQAAKRLKLFDKNYESLPGLTEKRILAFDLGNAANAETYRQLFKAAKYFRVIFFDVPVRFNESGAVSKVAKFEYVFNVVRR